MRRTATAPEDAKREHALNASDATNHAIIKNALRATSVVASFVANSVNVTSCLRSTNAPLLTNVFCA